MIWLKNFLSGVGIGAIIVLLLTLAFPKAEAAGYKSKGYSSSRSYSKPKATPYSRSYSRPAPRTRQNYSAPRARSSYNRPTTVIQKNYYQAPRNYGHGGGSYGGGMGGGSGVGLGTAILGGAAGAVGGMMLHDALTEDEGEKALKMQQEQKLIDEAKDQQARDDKMDQILENQKEAQREHIPEPSDNFFKVNPANQ